MEENENAEVVTEDTNDTVDTQEEESTEEVVEAQPKAAKPKRTPEEELAYFEGRVKRLQKDLGRVVESSKDVSKPAPGELDETQLDYLDLKGITDSDEIEVIQKVVAKTGQTVRQALKDDYVQAKLETLRANKAVQAATPSSTKRGGGQVNDLAAAIAKFEQSGVLPDDFETRSAVVNALEAQNDPSKPRWAR